MLKKLKSFRSQSGFTLVELSIVAMIAGMTASIALINKAQDLRYDLVHAQVNQLNTLGAALGNYESSFAANIISNTAITANGTTVANNYAPTLAELKAIGMLDNSFNINNFYPSNLGAGTFGTTIRLFPTGCTGTGCSMYGLAYMTTPITQQATTAVGSITTVPDVAVLGEALNAGGADYGYSLSASNTVITGYGGGWSEPNPVANTAGILGRHVLYTPPASVTTTVSASTTYFSGGTLTGVGGISAPAGGTLTIATATGKDLILGNLSGTPSSNLYANFKNSYFAGPIFVNGNITSIPAPGSPGDIVSGAGVTAATTITATGQVTGSDVCVTGNAKCLSTGLITTANSPTTIGKVSTQALGTHKFCVLSGTESSMGPAPTSITRQWVTGTWNGAWTYNSNGSISDYAQTTCFD